MSFDDDDDEGDVPALLSAPPAPVPAKKPAPAEKARAPKPTPLPPPAPAPVPASIGDLAIGSVVHLHGLIARPELNGCTGEVVGTPTDTGRIPVKVGAPHNQRIALKPSSLELVAPPPPAAAKKKAAVSPAPLADGDGLTVVRKAEGANPLKLPEVQKSIEEQQAGASAAQGMAGGSPSWVTPDLLQKIAADPLLRKAFTDPKCAAAMAALQKNPQEAMKQYGDVPEMRDFLMKFMKLMSDHFTAMGESQEEKRQEQQQPPIQAVKTPEEEFAMKAMQDPEVAAILQDKEVQQVLQSLQMGKSHEVEGPMKRPDMIKKLQRLSQAGLIGMHWER